MNALMMTSRTFKGFLICVFFYASMITLSGQAPATLSYQSVLYNPGGDLLTSQLVGVRIQLLQGSSTGMVTYEETHQVTTDLNGLLALQIGEGQAETGSFTAIDWSNGPYFVRSDVDPQGGTNYTLSTVTQLLSVPYALYANQAGNGQEPGTQRGDMQFWDGSSWVAVQPGEQGQQLTFCNGVPTWGPCIPDLAAGTTGQVSDSTATITGLEVPDMSLDVVAKGVCYDTTHNPTIYDSRTDEGPGDGSFSSSLYGLTANTTYFYRPYVTNAQGTKYGPMDSLVTLAAINEPSIDQITGYTARFNADLPEMGNEPILDKGFVWGRSSAPTLADSSVSLGGGAEELQVTWDTLTPSTQYYLRGYIQNETGVAYGPEQTFTTDDPPQLGQPYAGGLLIYLEPDGRHGIVASTTEHTSLDFMADDYQNWTSSTLRYSGDENTQHIIQIYNNTSRSPAAWCNALVHNGYDDWWLPSKDDMDAMDTYRTTLGMSTNRAYWTSSMFNDFNVWILTSSNGFLAGGKNFGFNRNTRAVRYF
jgi:hypothetical protein